MIPEQKARSLSPRQARAAHLVCLVPAHNEGGHIQEFLIQLYERTKALFKQVTLIVINDGSKDQTEEVVLNVLQTGLPIRYLAFSRNFGKESAISAGLHVATEYSPDAVLIIDGDFQHPLATIVEMASYWEGGIDMVYGVQTDRKLTESLPKRIGTRLFYKLQAMSNSLSQFSIPRDAGDFRLFDRCVLYALNKLPERNRYTKGLYAWVGYSSIGIKFQPNKRRSGTSSFDLFRLLELALLGITSFSTLPLRLAVISGFLIALCSFCFGCWILFEYLCFSQPIPGFTTIASLLLFFSGIQLLFIGILGEYIGNMFIEVKRRPLYLIARDEEAESIHFQSKSK